jgi:hypothetical protein
MVLFSRSGVVIPRYIDNNECTVLVERNIYRANVIMYKTKRVEMFDIGYNPS